MDEFMRDKLEDQKESAATAIFEALQSNQFKEEFAICVAYSYLEGVPSAIKLVQEANLYPIDIAALIGDTEGFIELWEKEERNRNQEMEYEHAQRY